MIKPLLTILLVVSAFFSPQAKTVNGVPIQDIDVEYVQIVGTGKLLSSRITIDIDFGQRDKAFVLKNTEIGTKTINP